MVHRRVSDAPPSGAKEPGKHRARGWWWVLAAGLALVLGLVGYFARPGTVSQVVESKDMRALIAGKIAKELKGQCGVL